MTATKHSAEVWVLVAPVQDWEESARILGVYGSLAAAQAALPRLRSLTLAQGGAYQYQPTRVTEAQHWRGDTEVETWTFHPPREYGNVTGWVEGSYS